MTKSSTAGGSTIKHRAQVVDNDNGVKKLGVRWQCSCGRRGTWTFSSAEAARNGRRHETKGNAKESRAARLIKNAVGLKF